MRRRYIAILMVMLALAIAVFVLAPVVYSPVEYVFPVPPGVHCLHGCTELVPAYESPSCAVFGVGVGQIRSGPYHFGCPPKSVLY